MKKTLCIVRWMLFLPAAILTYLAASLIASYVIFFLDKLDVGVGVFLNKVLPYSLSAIGGYFYIDVGTRVAPSSKLIAAYILLATLACYSIFVIYRAGVFGYYDIAIASFVRIVFAAIAVLMVKRFSIKRQIENKTYNIEEDNIEIATDNTESEERDNDEWNKLDETLLGSLSETTFLHKTESPKPIDFPNVINEIDAMDVVFRIFPKAAGKFPYAGLETPQSNEIWKNLCKNVINENEAIVQFKIDMENYYEMSYPLHTSTIQMPRTENPFYIVHLDVHPLFASGFKACLAKLPFTVEYYHFTAIEKALEHITLNHSKIDLLVTELKIYDRYSYDVAKKAKQFCLNSGRRIQVLLCAMSIENQLVRRGLEEGVFDKFIAKSAPEADLLNWLQKLHLRKNGITREERS